MTPIQLFGIVVRTLGLLICLATLRSMWHACAIVGMVPDIAVLETDNPTAGLAREVFLWELIRCAAKLVVGLWMLRGAKLVVDFAYPEPAQAEG